MPSITPVDAAEKLASAVESARPTLLPEIYHELFPDKPRQAAPSVAEMALYVRTEALPEELVDLWNVLFPKDRNVNFNVETGAIEYNEEWVGSVDY